MADSSVGGAVPWCTCALQPLAAYAPTMTVMGNHEAAGGFAEYSVRFQSAAVSAHVCSTGSSEWPCALYYEVEARIGTAAVVTHCAADSRGRSVHVTALIVHSAVDR